MPSVRLRYACSACDQESLKWEGRCPGCGEWNSLVEVRPDEEEGAGGGGRGGKPGRIPRPVLLEEAGAGAPRRLALGLGDLDLVLGGGLVPGSLLLLGGAPGIGKSTLLLQAAARAVAGGGPALYTSGEESAEQVRLRARRVGPEAKAVHFLAETRTEAIVTAARELTPTFLCVDSVQTLRSEESASAPGTVNQVRESAGLLQAYAKRTGTPTFLIGHVTKEGGLAGPRTLEHLVDVVLRFEGPRSSEHRILRSTKNRFGSAGEVAVFHMTGAGLEPVPDPGAAFLAGRPTGVSGSAVAVPLEGSRPLLAEVQALTTPSRYSNPQRMTTGFPSRRLAMLLAVLERRGGLSLAASDVFVNVVGGLRISDPAADLAVLAALVSAELDHPLPEGWAFAGEVGLGGEVRGAAHAERRVREVERGGLRTAVLPEAVEGIRTPTEIRRLPDVEALVGLVREGRAEGGAG